MDELNCWQYVTNILDRKQEWLERFESHMQEALGREKVIVRRPHAVLERGLILSLDEMPAFTGCEEEEKRRASNQRCTRTTFLYSS